MNDEQLIEMIASRVRARLMAGGAGPGHTRSNHVGPSEAGRGYRPPQDGVEEADCDDCGMCEVSAASMSGRCCPYWLTRWCGGTRSG